MPTAIFETYDDEVVVAISFVISSPFLTLDAIPESPSEPLIYSVGWFIQHL
jgi:hypothetical protein